VPEHRKEDPAWQVQIPSTAEAEKYIEMQFYRGEITYQTRKSALHQLRSVKGVTYKTEKEAKRASKNVKHSKVVPGVMVGGEFKEKGCSWLLGCILLCTLIILGVCLI